MDSLQTYPQLIGYSAALGSAMAWAVGSILFRRLGDFASPIGMNLGKCIIGALYLLTALVLTSSLEPMNMHTFVVLALSGVLGIAIGDTFFFKALINLGPRLTVLVGTLGPVFTIVMAVILFNERLSVYGWIGAALTLAGVNLVLWTDAPADEKFRVRWTSGILYALMAAICMALGILAAKVGVAEASALQGTLVRIVWAGMGLMMWSLMSRQLRDCLTPFKDPFSLKLIFVAVFVVIFGGFWLSLVALKYIDASIATILNSTEPIFILPLVAFILRERIPAMGIAGAIIAVIGVGLIFTG